MGENLSTKLSIFLHKRVILNDNLLAKFYFLLNLKRETNKFNSIYKLKLIL